MNPRIKIAVLATAMVSANILANEIEEVVITSSINDQSSSSVKGAIHVLTGDSAELSATQSLGESLDGLAGVYSADYGAGVGQPVIRGMSGSRIRVLNNGRVVRDVAGIGADHVNEVDMHNIEQIEIIRGPSSLLYANGAIGGIVNIVDNAIAKEDFSESELKIGLEAQSVNDGDSQNLSYENNLGGLNLSFAYKDSQFGNYDVPTGAILHDEDHDEHGDEDHDEHEEHEEDMDFLSNSDFENTSMRFGLSKTGDWGYVGVSINRAESIYGIPYHGEEHGDEHGDEEHAGEDHDEHEGEDHDEHEGERIFSTTDSDVLNLEGSYIVNNSWLKKVDYFLRDTKYSLTEQHAEEEHEGEEHEGEEHGDEHHDEGPTVFSNDSAEYGAIFDISSSDYSQKVSLNIATEDVSILGHEAFMNPTASDELTMGYYLASETDALRWDIAVRHDRIRRKGSITHMEHHDEDHDEDLDEDHGDDHDDDHGDEHDEHEGEMEYFDRDFSGTSAALSINKNLNNEVSVNVTSSILERAPSAVELFMNGAHLATGKFEVGDVNLKSEVSTGLDVSINYEKDDTYAVLSIFSTNVDDYIYLQGETEDDHEEHDEHDHGGLPLVNYMQKDAQFQGYEIEVGRSMEFGAGDLALSFIRDSVNAEFNGGEDVPRINPARNIYAATYTDNNLEVSLKLKDVESQYDFGMTETSTDGFKMLDFNAVRTYEIGGDKTAKFTLFARNLLDEKARNHSSFVKNEVPLPGRNFGVRVQLEL